MMIIMNMTMIIICIAIYILWHYPPSPETLLIKMINHDDDDNDDDDGLPYVFFF